MNVPLIGSIHFRFDASGLNDPNDGGNAGAGVKYHRSSFRSIQIGWKQINGSSSKLAIALPGDRARPGFISIGIELKSIRLHLHLERVNQSPHDNVCVCVSLCVCLVPFPSADRVNMKHDLKQNETNR